MFAPLNTAWGTPGNRPKLLSCVWMPIGPDCLVLEGTLGSGRDQVQIWSPTPVIRIINFLVCKNEIQMRKRNCASSRSHDLGREAAGCGNAVIDAYTTTDEQTNRMIVFSGTRSGRDPRAAVPSDT